MASGKKDAKSVLGDAISQLLMIFGTLFAVLNGFVPSLATLIYGNLTDELSKTVTGNCSQINFKVNITNLTPRELLRIDYLTELGINSSGIVQVLLNGSSVDFEVVGMDLLLLRNVSGLERYRPIKATKRQKNNKKINKKIVKGKGKVAPAKKVKNTPKELDKLEAGWFKYETKVEKRKGNEKGTKIIINVNDQDMTEREEIHEDNDGINSKYESRIEDLNTVKKQNYDEQINFVEYDKTFYQERIENIKRKNNVTSRIEKNTKFQNRTSSLYANNGTKTLIGDNQNNSKPTIGRTNNNKLSENRELYEGGVGKVVYLGKIKENSDNVTDVKTSRVRTRREITETIPHIAYILKDNDEKTHNKETVRDLRIRNPSIKMELESNYETELLPLNPNDLKKSLIFKSDIHESRFPVLTVTVPSRRAAILNPKTFRNNSNQNYIDKNTNVRTKVSDDSTVSVRDTIQTGVTGANDTQSNTTQASITNSKQSKTRVSQLKLNEKNVTRAKVVGVKETTVNVTQPNRSNVNATTLSNVTQSNITAVNVRQPNVTEDNSTQANIAGKKLTQSNVTEVNTTQPNVTGAHFIQTNVTGINVTQLTVTGVNVTQPNVTGVNVTQPNVTVVNVTQPNVTGINVTQPNVTGVNETQPNVTGINVTQPNVTGVNVTQPNITGVNATQPNVKAVNVTHPNVTGVNVTQPNITGINVTHPNVTGVNATHPTTTGVNITQPNITGVSVTQPNVTAVNVTHSNITGVNVTQPNLTGVIVTHPNVTGVNVTQTNVTGVNVTHPNVTAVNVTHPNVTAVNLTHPNVTAVNVTHPNGTAFNVTQPNVTGVNVTHPNVTGVNVTQTNVIGVNATQSNVTGVNVTQPNVTEVTVTQPNVTGINVTQPNVTGVNVTQPNITGVNATQPNVKAVNVTHPNVTGVNVTQPNITGINVTHPNVTGVNATHPTTTGVNITQPNITGVSVTQPNVTAVNVTHSNITGVNVTQPNLTGVIVTHPNVTGVNVTQTNVTGVNVTHPNVTAVNVTHPNVTAVNLTHPNVTAVNVTHPNGTAFNVTQPNVTGVNVTHPNVTGVNVTQTNVIGVNATQSNVTGVNVTQPNVTEVTVTQPNVTGVNLTQPNVTEINVTQPNVTGVNVTQPNVTGVNVTQPNVTGVNVTQPNVTGVTVTQLNVTGINVTQPNVTGVNVTQPNVTGINVTQPNVTGVNVTQPNVTGVNVTQPNVTGVNVTQPNVTGVNVSQPNVTGINVTQPNVTGVNVTQPNVTGVNVTQPNITGVNVTQPNVTKINVTQPNVTGVNVTQPNVTGVNVTQTNVTGVNVTQPNVTKINVTQPNVTGVNITQPNVTGVNVTQPNVTGVNVTQPNVTGVNVTQPNVTGVNVTQPNITGVNVTHPNVTGVNVTQPNVTVVNVTHPNVTGVNVTQPNVTVVNVTHPNVTGVNVTQPKVIPINITRPNVTVVVTIGISNITILVRNGSEQCNVDDLEVEVRMRKYAWYYVYAALVTLVCAYGQIVCWNVASERSASQLDVMANESALNKDPSIIDTQIHFGMEGFPSVSLPGGGMPDVNLPDIPGGLPQCNVPDIGMDMGLPGNGIPDVSDMTQLASEDIDALRGGLGGQIAFIIQNLASCMSGVLISLIKNWKLTLIMLMAAPFMGIVEAFVAKVEKYVTDKKKELQDQAGKLAGMGLASMKTVVDFAGEVIESQKHEQEVDKSGNLNRIKGFVKGFEKGTNTLIAFSFLGLGFWYSTTMLSDGGISPGALLTVFMAMIAGMMKMSGSAEQMDNVGDSKGSLDSILGFSAEEANATTDLVAGQLEMIMGKIDVFNVYFHYPSRPEYQILKSVNITAEPGQTIAILGEKGSGRSTIIKLLQGIYSPGTGRIRLDGHDLRTLDRRWLRRQLGMVHKNPEFFATTIAENISYGKDEDCTVKEIVRAAKAAGAHEFITRLPQGYETELSDDGSPLTAFQLHLLALARALIRDPRILLWEEDISLMDPDELRTLSYYLDQARRGRTAVISTSHVSIARLADVIVVLHEGRVVEQGTAEELLLSGTAFRYLCTVQYFEAKAAEEDKLVKGAGLKSSQSLDSHADTEDAYEYYKSYEKQRFDQGKIEQIKEMVRTKRAELEKQIEEKKEEIRDQVQQKVKESRAQIEILKMQLLDAPLLIGAVLGASLGGMIAPGLSFLFSEIQKFLNDSERVLKEGPFYASMFVLLGAVVAFGGTIEKYLTTLVNEKFRQRLEKKAFEKVLSKNSAPKHSPAYSLSTGLPANTGIKLEDDNFDLKVLDQHTEVVPAPFRSECKATPPESPTDDEPLPEINVPDTEDIAHDLDNIPTDMADVPQTDLEVPDGLPSNPQDLIDETPLENLHEIADIKDQPLKAFGETPIASKHQSSMGGIDGVQSQIKPSGICNSDNKEMPKGIPGMSSNEKTPAVGHMQSMSDKHKIPGNDLLPAIDPEKQAQEAMDKMQRDIDAMMQKSIGRFIGPEVQSTISSFLTFYLALSTGWKMTLVALAGYPVILMSQRIQQNQADDTVKPKEENQVLDMGFKKIKAISALGMETKFAKKFKDGAMEKYKHVLKKIIGGGLAFAVGQAMVFMIYAIALRYGCFLITTREMAALEVLSVLMTVLFGSSASSSSQAPAQSAKETSESANRLIDTDEDPEPIQVMSDKDMNMRKATGEVEFHHADLPDPIRKGNLLLNDLDILVNKGETMAMVLMDHESRNPIEMLLERYYDPSSGRVFVDGRDLRSFDLRWLRHQIAVVSSRSFLPHHTVGRNIAYGDNTRTVLTQDIQDAAYSANAHYFIMRMPKSYDTIPAEEGMELTSSERMRISIARAIVRNPSILIIEEIDDTDEELEEALDNLSAGRTCLTIARQRKTLDTADKVVLVYRGRVLEQGRRQDLLARPSLLSILTGYNHAPEMM